MSDTGAENRKEYGELVEETKLWNIVESATQEERDQAWILLINEYTVTHRSPRNYDRSKSTALELYLDTRSDITEESDLARKFGLYFDKLPRVEQFRLLADAVLRVQKAKAESEKR